MLDAVGGAVDDLLTLSAPRYFDGADAVAENSEPEPSVTERFRAIIDAEGLAADLDSNWEFTDVVI